jgi:hypothetical protein
MPKRALLAALLLLSAPLASASAAEHPQRHLTKAGRAAAAVAAVTPADLDQSLAWSANPAAPAQGPAGQDCPSFHPRRADLVINGTAAASFSNAARGISIASTTGVYETPAMVRLLVRRTFAPPQLLPCVGELARRALPKTLRVVSVRRLPFAGVGRFTVAWRMTVELRASHERLWIDQVAFGRARTEIVVSSTYPQAAAGTAQPIEEHVVRALAARIRA